MNVLERLRRAFAAATPEGGDASAFAAAVRPSTDPKFGDYQANGCMALAKALKRNPRELAQGVAAAVDLAPLAGPPEVAGPGFLNVRLRDEWIAETLGDLLADERLGITPPERPKTVVDRLLLAERRQADARRPRPLDRDRREPGADLRGARPQGHPRQPPGRLGLAVRHDPLGLEEPPRRGRLRGRPGGASSPGSTGWPSRRSRPGDSTVEDAARAETAKLHAGDPENRALWERFMPHCLAGAPGASTTASASRSTSQLGESFYDPMLAGVVKDLEAKGLAGESEGATVVFVEGTKAPFIVRKSDGAFNYATTDLATIQYREETWHPDQVLYVVDHRQGDHFKQLFAVARRWGYDRADLEHVAFGTILGQGPQAVQDPRGRRRRPRIAAGRGRRRGPQGRGREQPGPVEPEERQTVAEVVGLGAIKYADLSQNRLSDYVFDWEKMLAMNGNTGDLSPVRLRAHPEHLPQGEDDARGDPRATARPSS